VSRGTGRGLHHGALRGGNGAQRAGAAAGLRWNARARRGAADDDAPGGWDGAGPATWQGWADEAAPFVHATDRTICALETAAAVSAQTIARGESARQPGREVERRFKGKSGRGRHVTGGPHGRRCLHVAAAGHARLGGRPSSPRRRRCFIGTWVRRARGPRRESRSTREAFREPRLCPDSALGPSPPHQPC
jgi:hypothetical protein